MKSQEIREQFVDYFVQKFHKNVPGSSLIPVGDPTLLFTTAGMVQFKSFWDGTARIQYPRAITIQKCLRLSDLENVGTTPRHDTFFEMLGNFSFGDYFKKEAINYAWDFLTRVMGISPQKLWITVYKEDDEAKEIWLKEQQIAANRIVSLGDKDNFWGPAGESGPCGPCSEIIYDMGKEKGCGKLDCLPGCDCERWLEIWNLVFPQFEKKKGGEYAPLKNRGIDTGMGLERLAMVLQQKENIFETDLFFPIIEEICDQAGVSYGKDTLSDKYLKIIADHIRALTFTMAENITPSNEGRGYVLRRLIRRASKYGRDLGFKTPFLYSLVNTVINIMQGNYPELVEKSELVKQILAKEEERFLKTLDQGMQLLQDVIEEEKKKGKDSVSGKAVFTLYDTYGFPFEMTEEILAQEKMTYNREEFQKEQEEARKIARQSWQGDNRDKEAIQLYRSLFEKHGKTSFIGYKQYEANARVVVLLYNRNQVSCLKSAGETVEIILDNTPFYAESGGQVADTGYLLSEQCKVQIKKVEKTPDELFVHTGILQEGEIVENSEVKAVIDVNRRWEIMKHHTATHLLQAALRLVVGNHVGQTGSYVCADHFRFDFTHFQALSQRELHLICEKVNDFIQQNSEVKSESLGIKEARKKGALAFFGEKYSDFVRVITIPETSRELCGGTHVPYTGHIGYFQILSESSVASGVRRIEAVVGQSSVQKSLTKNRILHELEGVLKTPFENLPQAVVHLEKEFHLLQKEIDGLRLKELLFQADELIQQGQKINDIILVIKHWKDYNIKDLLHLADRIRQKSEYPAALLFVNEEKEKVQLIVALTKDLLKQYHAGKIVKELAALVGGGGGGKPDCAQAGGKDPGNIPQVIERFPKIFV